MPTIAPFAGQPFRWQRPRRPCHRGGGATFAPRAEDGGAGRTISRLRSWRCCSSTNWTAKPSGKSLTTRLMQAPTAKGVPIGGCTWADTATPETDMSMTKHPYVVPSAKVRVECGLAGMIRVSFLASGMLGFFCLFSSQVSLFASFSRIDRVISSSNRKPPAIVSLIKPSSLPKSLK